MQVNQATHNKIVSFIWGVGDDVLRHLFRRGKQILATVSQELTTELGVVLNYTSVSLMADGHEVGLVWGKE